MAIANGEQSRSGRLFAVLIGVNEYDHLAAEQKLANAVDDVESIDVALRSTHAPDMCDVQILASARARRDCPPPTRANILEALDHAASLAGEDDAVLVYFAGHGELHDSQTWLLPQDATGTGLEHTPSMISLGQIDERFADSECSHRVQLIDACNAGGMLVAAEDAPTQEEEASDDEVRPRGIPLCYLQPDEFPEPPPGWAVLHACSPGECSYEASSHGFFSESVAQALRGEADADGNGVVSLAELVAFVTDRVQARAAAHARAEQTPSLYTRGVRMNMPVTPRGRLSDRSDLAHRWRKSEPGPDFAALVRQRLGGDWTSRLRLHDGLFRWGGAVLFGAVLTCEGALLTVEHGSIWPVAFGAILGGITALVWVLSVGWAVAAAERCWHWGGYVPSIMMGGWLLVSLPLLLVASAHWAGRGGTGYAAYLLLTTLCAGLIALAAHNCLNTVLSFVDLLGRGEPAVAERSFRELREKQFDMDIPNVAPFVGFNPTFFMFLLVAVVAAGALVHIVPAAVRGFEAPADLIAVALDGLLVISAAWFGTLYQAQAKALERHWWPPA